MTEAKTDRKTAKARTRERLLEAALDILDTEGEAALTTTEVTSRAGIAQSSFYVHFADMDDLLHSLIDWVAIERRRRTRLARQSARSSRASAALRETFRIPLDDFVTHPRLFRLVLRSRFDRSTPLGDWSRQLLEDTRAALVEDLVASGMPAATARDRQQAEMVADGIIALTETLALGHLEGRYPDLDHIVDVLVAFSRGYFPMLKNKEGR